MKNMRCLIEYFKGIWKDRYVLISLVRQDLQMKYNRSALGVAWQIITPLGLSFIIGAVYSVIYGVSPIEFMPILFSGLNPWLFVTSSADGGTNSYISAEGYLKQTQVSPQIFPIRTVLVAFVNLLYAMVAFFVVYLILQPHNFSLCMLAIIPGLVIILLAGIGLANFSSAITVNVRDFQPLQSLALQGIFYATPIIYLPAMLDEKGYSLVYKLNPFYHIINVVRSAALGVGTGSFIYYFVVFVCVAVFFLISAVVTMKNNHGIAMKL